MSNTNRLLSFSSWAALSALVLFCFPAWGADQPQWGQAWTRNMVCDERGLPDSFDPKTGKNIKWTAELGTETHSTPIVARGRVYIGTNNGHPRDPKEQGDRGVLMCFDEKTGRFLWQLAVPKREEDIYFDWPKSGIASPATVEGDRLYIVSNRGEVLCLDLASTYHPDQDVSKQEARSAATGKDACPTVLWRFNLTTEAGIWSHDAAHSSILIHGDHLYLNTGTGVDNTHKRIRTPDAPSLVVLDKRSGKFLARDNEHIAPNIFHSTWCSPSLGMVNGRELLFFAAGNGIVYAFETLPVTPTLQHSNAPAHLTPVWRFDFDPGAPKTNVHQYNSNRREGPSDFYGMPVFDNNRLFVAGGGDLWWGKTEAWLKCIDTTKTGDITTNGLVWSYPLQKHVLSTPSVYNGLVFIADCGHTVHCVDAKSGKPYWTESVDGEVWASPLVTDGKLYLGTRSGGFYVFAADKEKKILSMVELHDPISGTITAANHTLYLATMNHLYAIAATSLTGK